MWLRKGCGQVEWCALPLQSVNTVGKEVKTQTLALSGLGWDVLEEVSDRKECTSKVRCLGNVT